MSNEVQQHDAPPAGGPWPEPRLRALQVDELYKFAPTATGYSYFGALLTLGVLITAGDIGRGAVWFVWATALAAHGIWTIARPDNSFSQSAIGVRPVDEPRTTTVPLLWSVTGRF